jgi:hypothetical protein
MHEKRQMLETPPQQVEDGKKMPQEQEMSRHRRLHDEEQVDPSLPPEMLVVQENLRPQILIIYLT